MENEFDFFNNLNFGTDFTKQGLGGYGTYTDQYNTPVIENEAPVLIESPTGIETIPTPIIPFINQGGDNDNDGGNGGITTNKLNIKKINDSYLGNPDYQGDLENAKNDTNIKNLVNMGLVDKAKEYVKNNYGYMIMNFIFPGSGFAAKVFVDNKKKKEAAAAEELAKIEEEKIATLAKAEEEKKQEIIRQAAYEQARQDKETYAALEASITRGDGGQGYDRPDSGPTSVGAGMGVGGGYSTDYGFKDGGRTGYGTGGIVSL
jgi:hypothetical protein